MKNKRNIIYHAGVQLRFYNKLWVKSFLINNIFLVFLLIILFFLILSEHKQRMHNQLERNAINSAELLANQISFAIDIWDKQSIGEKINIVISDSSELNAINYCSVYSRKTKEFVNFPPKDRNFVKEFCHEHPDERKVFRDNQYFYVIQPVTYQSESDFMKWSNLPDEMLALSPFDDPSLRESKVKEASFSPVVGEIHMAVGYKGIKTLLNETRNYFIFLSFPVFIFSLVFHYFQTRLFARKLSHLSEQAKKVSVGQEFDIKVDSDDEIGILGQSFQEMVRKLIYSQKEVQLRNKELEEANTLLDEALQKIQSFNLELEQKVQERTRQLERLNVTLKEKNQELHRANETKVRFLSMMSHELRTPLNAIIGFSQLALKRVADSFLKDFFTEIKQNGEHLLTLINSVLDFSKLDAGQFELIMELFDMNRIMTEVVSSTHAIMENKQIQIKYVSSSTPKMAYGDAMRIKQVLFNLASNASKFTYEGYIEFSCQPLTKAVTLPIQVPEKFYNRTMVVMVKDSGIGIDENDQEAIFDPFKQLDSSESRVRGTGLGLAISKNLMELHHTNLLVKSAKNKGTIMFFFVPQSAKAFEELEIIV